MKNYILFSGSSNTKLAQKVADSLGVSLGKVDLHRFADGEIRPWIQEDVRGKTVFILQSLSKPIDENFMEMAFMADAIKSGAPEAMIAIIPYLGYARQDRQTRLGEPISARVVATFLEACKFDEVITVDIHNSSVIGFFRIPAQNISAKDVFVSKIKESISKNTVIVSPDIGSAKRSRKVAEAIDLPLVIVEKNRPVDQRDKTEMEEINVELSGKDVIIYDDMISTGGTIINCAKVLKGAGTNNITVCATHGVFAGEAIKNILDSGVTKLIVSDTINIPEYNDPRLEQVSIAGLLSDLIKEIVG